MKAYMRVEVGGGGTLYPGVECSPLPQANIDYVQQDEIGEIVSSILLKGFQKLGYSQSLLTWHKNERVQEGWGVWHTTLGKSVRKPLLPNSEIFT